MTATTMITPSSSTESSSTRADAIRLSSMESRRSSERSRRCAHKTRRTAHQSCQLKHQSCQQSEATEHKKRLHARTLYQTASCCLRVARTCSDFPSQQHPLFSPLPLVRRLFFGRASSLFSCCSVLCPCVFQLMQSRSFIPLLPLKHAMLASDHSSSRPAERVFGWRIECARRPCLCVRWTFLVRVRHGVRREERRHAVPRPLLLFSASASLLGRCLARVPHQHSQRGLGRASAVRCSSLHPF